MNQNLVALGIKLLLYYMSQKQQTIQQDGPVAVDVSAKDRSLLTFKNKLGAVAVLLGTRGTGKTELAYRLAEFVDKPTFAVSPEQAPHPNFIRRIEIGEIETVPSDSTLICDDLPVYASNRDYSDSLVRALEKLIPMVRHERRMHLIFCSQSSAQADKYILDCDIAFFKPLGLLYDDLERPNIRRIYRDLVDPCFAGKSEEWIVRHAYMLAREFKGIVEVRKATSRVNITVEPVEVVRQGL